MRTPLRVLATGALLASLGGHAFAFKVDFPPDLEDFFASNPLKTTPASPGDTIKAGNQSAIDLSLKQASTARGRFASTRNRCPRSCDSTSSQTQWTTYHQLDSLSSCNETMLLDFSLYTAVDDPSAPITIRACTLKTNEATGDDKPVATDSCFAPHINYTTVDATLRLSRGDSAESKGVSDVLEAAQQIQGYLAQQPASCNETIIFASSGQAVMGLYAGSWLQSQGAVGTVLQEFIIEVESGVSGDLQVQHCDGPHQNSRYSMGIIANVDGDVASVQRAVATWRNGNCVNASTNSVVWKNITYQAAPPSVHSPAKWNISAEGPSVPSTLHEKRSDCSTIQVVSGDTCTSLPAECGITAAQFTEYNPSSTLCSSLAVGQYVCCSAGTLPDKSPKPDANGYCALYEIQSGDTCDAIGAANSITSADIESYNTGTWGWMGCGDLLVGSYICLSTGYPPMPSIVSNAVCGPQVNGTPAVPPGTDLSTLNECPLNACCDIWGQCGTTVEFCTPSTSTTGAPGTAAPGENGCISNCGTDIVMSAAPAEFIKIGYFEGFDLTRPCLQMSVADVNTTAYTHIYLAFATLTADFAVDISDIAAQFQAFIYLSGVKRILSFGGWEFSTSAQSYAIFREAVQEANRGTFVTNVVNFINEYNLDGVDLDWEYPGEPDIPGIPADTEDDAINFFLFLVELGASMAANAPGKILSVTAPGSYWYMKNIPIAAISVVVDYVVIMTYDLHGQWDYGNAFSDPGCPDGNCLRSQVNLTETINSLSMITKAGVPSNMIAVGVTSYGRSFQMTTPECTGPMCTYTGPESGATAGACTQTPGYLANGEIDDIFAASSGTSLLFLDDSYSNILVYNDTQWVSFMDDDNKATRAAMYQGLNFAGTADWAVDLQPADSGTGNSGDTGGEIFLPPDFWNTPSPQVTCYPPCTLVPPPLPLETPVVVTWSTYVTSFLTSLANGSLATVSSSYSIPPFTVTDVPVWPVTVSTGDGANGTWIPVQSVQPSPLVVTLPPDQVVFTPTPYASSTTSSGGVVPIFFPTARPITIQPMPTIPITFPPSFVTPTVSYVSGSPPNPTTTAGCAGCGVYNCALFGCGTGCGLFSCGGGCGIWGCFGGCGLFGCAGDCPLGACDGSSGSVGQLTDGETCDVFITATYCIEAISSYSTAPMTTYSTLTSTVCQPTEGCAVTDTTTTTTISTDYPTNTDYYWAVPLATEPADVVSSMAASIASMQSAWDATRWSAGTATTSSVTSGGTGVITSPGGSSGGSSFLGIFAYQTVVASGTSAINTWSWQGLVLPYPTYTTAEACDFNDYRVIDGGYFSAGTTYPTSLGSFTLGSYTNCNYSGGSSTAVGQVTCDGGVTIACSGENAYGTSSTSPTVDCLKANDDLVGLAKSQMFLQVYCAF